MDALVQPVRMNGGFAIGKPLLRAQRLLYLFRRNLLTNTGYAPQIFDELRENWKVLGEGDLEKADTARCGRRMLVEHEENSIVYGCFVSKLKEEKIFQDELVTRICNQTGLTKVTVTQVLESFKDTTIEMLGQGRDIKIRHWGKLRLIVRRGGRLVRDLINNRTFVNKDYCVIKFEPYGHMREALKRAVGPAKLLNKFDPEGTGERRRLVHLKKDYPDLSWKQLSAKLTEAIAAGTHDINGNPIKK